jgi:hypothetical protein
MDGKMEKPFVIGKAVKPRCFKNNNLPVIWRNNKKAWMTAATTMEEWLNMFNAKIKENTHKKTKLRSMSPRANYTDRATTDCRRS